jgi:hypothetical protein
MTTSAAAQPRTLSTPDPVAGRIGGQVIVEARSGYCAVEHDTERPGTSPPGATVEVVRVAAVVVLDVLDGAVEVVDTTDTGAGATVVVVDDGATVVAGAHSAFRGSVGSGYGHACTA